MANEQTNAKQNNAKKEKFIALLHELFQLNQPELDFGIYRIMHARKDDINRFIESDLPKIIADAFDGFQSQDKQSLQAELDDVIAAVKKLKKDPDEEEAVKELRAKLNQSLDLGREEGEVYDALITFFSRYYDEGDFVSRRVYKDGTYAIPYNGEEVVLHWANKDQYYIKSSETLRDYSFRLDPNNEENPMRVHFKLVDADPGAQNNVKETEATKRIFILDSETPWQEIDGEQSKELQLRFHYRATTTNDWSASAKASATAAAAKKPPTQDHCRQMTVDALLGADSDLPPVWKNALSRPYTKADGESADYSMLQGQLNNYTKRNTFDYFIHKDLGGFLTRELDFYIKNELMRWEDIAALKSQPARLAPLLSKVEVIRAIGERIVAFLAQLEDFQKQLWSKKKFVAESNYCITLDYVPERFYEKIAKNNLQAKQWVNLGFIGPKTKLSEEYLRNHQNLIVDTALYSEEDKAALTGEIEDLDASCDGLLIHSDNYQALNLLQERYSEKTKCIYIDPPYNTAVSSIPYKNDYKHSSWGTLMHDRIRLMKPLMQEDGAIFVSIDKSERSILEYAMDEVFGRDNKVEELIWIQNTNDGRSPTYSTNHEYVEVYSKNKEAVESDVEMFREPKPGYFEVMELVSELNPKYPAIEDIQQALSELYAQNKVEYKESVEAQGLDWDIEKRNDPWKGIYAYQWAEYRDQNGAYVEPSEAKSKQAEIWIYTESDWTIMSSDSKQSTTTKDPSHKNYRYYEPIHPVTGKPCKLSSRGWKGTQFIDPDHPERNSFESLLNDHRISFGPDEKKVPRQKRMLHEVDSNVCKSVFNDYSDGEKETTALFGRSGVFLAPKHTKFVQRFILQGAGKKDLILDCFGGSGSTADAVISLNREDDGERKYVLAEMGAHFDTILKPRVMKTVFSRDWHKGKPKADSNGNLNSVSHCMKYIRLESYEDALANLKLKRGKAQQDLLDSQSPDDQAAREAYLLNYMLDVETRGSDSLLNVSKFVDPTRYQLMVRNPTGDETKMVNVDLLETFNWLIGLTVEYIAAPIHFDAELSQAEHGRWQARVKRAEDGRWWFRSVVGTTRKGQKVLIVWRNLPSVIDKEDNGPVKDNAVLDAVLIDKLKIRMTESPDDEFDILYVNGDHNISIPKKRNGELLEARVKLIEEDFHRLMFSTETH
jgi:adenine-specific DNA-methyltransferase